MDNIEITEKCEKCGANLWLRISGRMPLDDDLGSGFYLVKWCKVNGDFPLVELIRVFV